MHNTDSMPAAGKSQLCNEGQQKDLDLTVSIQVAVLTIKMAICNVFEEKPQSSRQLWPSMALMNIKALYAVSASYLVTVKTSARWKKLRNYFYKKGKRTPRNSITHL